MKHRLLTCIFIFFACLAVVGQVNQVWWSKGRVLHVNPVTGIDSVTYGQFVNADTFLIVIDRASRRIVYDTIDEHVPGMVFHDTIHTTHTVYLEPGRRIGVFSVAKDKQVSFSQGNLQYIQNQNIWKFADQQYEYIGAGNVKDGKLANKIDLFGWSADNTTAPFGVSTSTNAADYSGEFVDWGVNEINIDAPNTWRTLSKDEWEYLFEKRKNAQKLYGVAQVNGSNGIIILPDNWSFDNGISFKTGLHSVETDDYSIFQSFTDQEFSVLESFGAVFLHASGWREGISIEKSQRSGYYWSSIPYNNTDAYRMTFYSYYLKPCDIHYKYRGRSVRLVYDTIVPPPAPCMFVKVNDTLSINMMCVEGGTFVMGAGSDAHQVTLSDYLIAETELTQELWEAVMNESYDAILSTHGLDVFQKGPNYPAYGLTWYDAQEFIERLNKLTGLQFRMPTEAEWEYAARGGNKSKGYKFSGSDSIDEVAWHALNSDNQMHIVATKKPNELGIYDMTGNSWELCLDGYAAYPTYSQTNPLVPLKTETVVRGGSSYSSWNESNYLITYRLNRAPNALHNRNTLRLVLSDEVVVKTIVIDNKMAFNMRMVDGGTFTMGDDSSNNTSPAHQVTLSDYYIGQTEVTQALWKAVMGTNPSDQNDDSYKPVGNVSWDDAQLFVEKLSNKTGLNFHLPTEAEWEYAAMGGKLSQGYKYPGSDNIDDVAWYGVNSDNKLHVVGTKMPNELGIYDMSGNVWEWVSDWYGNYSAQKQINPQGPSSGTGRVLRSGSYVTQAAYRCAIKYRQSRKADYPDVHIGFRIVLMVEFY